MSNVVITPKKLHGSLNVPPSKSLTLRAIICAAFSRGTSEIYNVRYSPDIIAAIEAVKALGARVSKTDNCLYIDGSETYFADEKHTIDCKSYESILRFLVPLSVLGDNTEFVTDEDIADTRLKPYCKIFDACDVYYKKSNHNIIKVGNGDISGIINLKSTVNSQYISGLLLALPLMRHDSVIRLNEPFHARSHIDITIDVMRKFGIKVTNIGYHTFRIHGRQAYKPTKYYSEGDYIKAAFFIAAGTLGNFVICKGLPEESNQSDRAVLDIIEHFGGKIVREKGNIAAVPSPLFGRNINISAHPDLLPIVAMLAIFADGETVISGIDANEKENLSILAQQMNSIGAAVIEHQNSLVIEGSSSISGGVADCHGNYRLALALAIASTHTKGNVTIENIECVSKHYPEFWDDFKLLGGIAN